jgi:hypothetical protein
MINEFNSNQAQIQKQPKYFSPENLNPDARQVYDVLREFGVKIVCCDYNGGGDEEFAQLSLVRLEDKIIEFNNLMPQLIDSSLGSKLTGDLLSYYSYVGEPSPEQRVEFFLELFANSLATYLLGKGYGTGEFSMEGSFSANLENGELIIESQEMFFEEE